ncbi:hypothetical protein I6E61_03180 [Psychrobacter sp. NZS113]|uniref:hypothetical protein n=1 Tax=Psychrobacter sp. NZS113 TaxID=2792045 RepID=UPI0018CDF1E3|nr:hypothetical protein [Psychrobacter sp. NZS113]MBH0095385.1 hypothetical protein [Psychrobacter sp. NZS113]
MKAGLLSIDIVPIEGIDLKAIDDEFDLRSKGYSTMVVISFDYHHEDDFNPKISKSRLSEEAIFIKA